MHSESEKSLTLVATSHLHVFNIVLHFFEVLTLVSIDIYESRYVLPKRTKMHKTSVNWMCKKRNINYQNKQIKCLTFSNFSNQDLQNVSRTFFIVWLFETTNVNCKNESLFILYLNRMEFESHFKTWQLFKCLSK